MTALPLLAEARALLKQVEERASANVKAGGKYLTWSNGKWWSADPAHVLAWCAEQRETLDDAEALWATDVSIYAPATAAGCAVRMVARVHAACQRALGAA